MKFSSLVWVRRLACIGLSAWLAACGGGGGSDGGGGTDSGSPAAGDYFPLHVGDTWHYVGAGGEVTRTTVSGTRVVDGATVWVLQSTDSGGTTEELLAKSGTGVIEVPASGAAGLMRTLSQIPRLNLPLTTGTTEVLPEQRLADAGDLDADGQADSATVRAQLTVLGFEDVSTAAGSWRQVAHLRTVVTQTLALSASRQNVTITATGDDWYAPDVGLVRSTLTVTGPGLNDRQTDEQSLTAYRVGALRSEAVAPTIVQRVPAPDSTLQGASPQVVFSEVMDRGSLPGDALVVSGADGQPLAGSVAWQDDRTLAFTPAAPLPAGSLVVRVSAALTDRAGNALAGDRAWSFTIDRQGPQVVSVSPADGSADVALSSVITLVFDEAPDPASVTADTVSLSGPTGTLPAALALAGRSLTVTPQQALQRGATYQVAVQGVADASGNRATAAFVSRFQADGGRFTSGVALGGLDLVSNSTLIGDLDGDGRADAAVLGGRTNPGPASVFVYRQRADGTLAAPEALALQTTCSVRGMVAADMDRDGRLDLLVMHGCGVEVLRQAADGRLVTQAQMAAAPQGIAQVSALRGAGLPAVVALALQADGPTFLSQPQVWRQGSAGVFASPVTVPSTLRELYQLSVADLNGDGLDDLLLGGLLSDASGFGVEWLLQRSDGSFGPTAAVLTSACGLQSSTAAGDVNADGRTDLVLAIRDCNGEAGVQLMLQDASGGFATSTRLASAANLGLLDLADIDGDGRADIVATHGSAGLGVYLRRADGSWTPEALYPSADSGMGLAVGDLTGDARPDILSSGLLLVQKPALAGASAARPGPRRATAVRGISDLRTPPPAVAR